MNSPALGLMGSTAVGWMDSIALGSADGTALALVALNGLVLAVPLWHQWRIRSYDLFHPLVWYSLMYGVPMFLVKGTALALGATSETIDRTPDPVESLHRALACSLVASVCLMAGFWGIGNRGPRVPALLTRSRRYSPMVVVAFYAIARVAAVLLVSEGALGTNVSRDSGQNWAKISLLRPVAACVGYALFLMVFMAAGGRSRTLSAAAGAVIAVDLGFGSLSGSRSTLFATVLVGIAAVTYARFPIRRPRTIFKWGLIAAAALTVGMLFITNYRFLRSTVYSPDDRLSVGQSAGLLLDSANVVQGLGARERAEFLAASFLERFSAIENLAVTLGRAEELRDLEETMGMDHNIRKELLWAFVPRVLFPAKPLIGTFGLDFSRIYLDDENVEVTYNAPTVVGDLYRNGGIPGIVLGMSFMGIVLRWLYQRLILDAPGFPMAALFFVMLSRVNWENTFSPFLTENVRALVPLLGMTFLLEFVARFSLVPERKPTLGQDGHALVAGADERRTNSQ